VGNDDFGQPRALFLLFDQGQRQRMFANVAASMGGVPKPIIDRQLALFAQVHPDYAAGVAAALEQRAR
jgi:catalase